MNARNPIALVTGATGGLGAAVVAALLRRGRVVGVGGSNDRLDSLRQRLGNPDGLTAVCADLTTEAGVTAAFEAATGVEVVVNVAGGFAMGPIADTPLATWDRLMALNARTTFLACRQAFAAGTCRSIINVGARPGIGGSAQMSAYAASKAAVCNLTESLALEGLDAGIRVNAILPSVIDTPANRLAMPEADPSEWVTPESLAGVVGFLASDAARDVTGALVPVYGRA